MHPDQLQPGQKFKDPDGHMMSIVSIDGDFVTSKWDDGKVNKFQPSTMHKKSWETYAEALELTIILPESEVAQAIVPEEVINSLFHNYNAMGAGLSDIIELAYELGANNRLPIFNEKENKYE